LGWKSKNFLEAPGKAKGTRLLQHLLQAIHLRLQIRKFVFVFGVIDQRDNEGESGVLEIGREINSPYDSTPGKGQHDR
jgi:hypothetical protein